ncbi:GTP-binding protein [Methanobacterium paludis]|uniref:Small GTP-binding protein n=1 Tax=Methanobacterium paludis (strain DSM 25820 / JCM 18151 / SWAN1) TaxID=868131 RepID=F6D7X9_METPW|nr:GTP-binding protein [Methanobacterium paludis]AEG18502.1 small GTP-binding protein [Methanobacterium paludis]
MESELQKDMLKIVVFGALDAGKTTFVETLSGKELLMKGEVGRITNSFDFVQLDHDDYLIQLFATPGHRRFSFMWPTLATGMHGAIFLIDSTVGISPVDQELIEFISKYDVPYVVAINKDDLVHLSVKDVKTKLELPDEIPIIHTSSFTKQNLDLVMNTLIGIITNRNNK